MAKYVPDGHYVYMVSRMDSGSLLYVGKGKGDRWRHSMSGASSSKELNRLYFQGVPLQTEVVRMGLKADEAAALEKELIVKRRPVCNVHHVPKAPKVKLPKAIPRYWLQDICDSLNVDDPSTYRVAFDWSKDPSFKMGLANG